MRRVYIISSLRRMLSPFAIKGYATLFLLWGIGKQVFVAKVIENAPGMSDPVANISFFSSAMAHTNVIVQALVLGATLFALWSLADLIYRGRQSLLTPF